MKNFIQFTLAFFFLHASIIGSATEKKDPYLRDDDISLTTVTAQFNRNADGLYLYIYDIRAPQENTGSVSTFILDISCPEPVDSLGFNPQDYPSDASMSVSRDNKHIPVAIDAPWGQAAIFGISESNAVHWLLASKPGMDSLGLQLISTYPPGSREYQLIPDIRYREHEWDYESAPAEDPNLPWVDDFTITGLTTGPACPGEEYPDHEEPSPRFLGSPFPGQPELNNALLSYSAPLRDQFHVEPGVRELEMTIHYHDDIDPKSFVVTPEKNQLRRLFNPQPGSQETVRIPLQPGKNRIELQVQSRFTPPGRATTLPRETRGREGVSLDRDVFVIRVPGD